MRNAFADEIKNLAGINENIVMLSGDIGNRLFDNFKEKYADRFINCGVAEQNMTGVAAGLALMGYRPFTYTIGPFVTTRCLEQIKIDVAYHNLPVTVVAVGAGLSYAGLGPTHHSCEDVAFLSSIPNMQVICPADRWETRAALRAIVESNCPTYLRLGKKGEPDIHGAIPKNFSIGKGITIKEGSSVCVISSGTIVSEALDGSKLLEKRGISSLLINMHSIKPFDYQLLQQVSTEFDFIVTIEEHTLFGGLGSLVAHWMATNPQVKSKLLTIGTPDEFYKKSGSQKYAREQLRIDAKNIALRIENFISGKTFP